MAYIFQCAETAEPWFKITPRYFRGSPEIPATCAAYLLQGRPMTHWGVPLPLYTLKALKVYETTRTQI
jgi:hypothetical protein